MCSIPKTPGEAVRGGEAVNETEQGCQGDREDRRRPLWPFPRPVSGLPSLASNSGAPPPALSNGATAPSGGLCSYRLWRSFESRCLFTTLSGNSERSVLKHLRFRKLKSQTQWKKSLAISLTISHLLLQGSNLPTARPSEDTVVGQGLSARKGKEKGTPRR